MIRAVLFDLGGTLHVSDSLPGRDVWFARRLLDRLADYGITPDLTPEALAPLLAQNAESYKHDSELTLRELPPAEIWSRWYLRDLHLAPEQVAPFAEEFSFLYDYERVRVRRRPQLKETLLALKRQGLRVGVISNIISRTVVPHFLAEYDIDSLMSCVLTSSGTGIRKPDPAIFRIAEDELGLAPQELAYVGDTISRDVRGARQAGWGLVIQIGSPASAYRDRGLENGPWQPDACITELSEIPALLEQYNKSAQEGTL